jgi:phage-related tail fiber protein
MRKLLYLIIPLILIGCGTTQPIIYNNADSYYPISNVDAKFKYANHDVFVYHKDLNRIESENGNNYSVRQIKNSSGKTTETLYRIDNGNVVYFDKKSATENMIMPSDPKVGFVWRNSDNSWEYEIVDLKANLETPTKKYSDLLVMRATQISNRDANKLMEYLNYYEKGTGKVASFGNGKLMTYKL